MDSESELAPAVRSILAAARERTGGDRVSVDARSLPDALSAAAADGRAPVIAEVKPTSPTTDGRRDDDPVELAETMVDAGAAAISVLTEPEHFGGSPETLSAVREAVDVPVLRKDFILREEQMDVVAADVLLLIVRFVDDLEALIDTARERGFQPLVEVHDRDELETALAAGAEIIGVNNRDLAKLEVDLETFERVAPAAKRRRNLDAATDDAARPVPDDVTLIAESGITDPADVRRMRAAGADGLLIGSAIMDGDVRANTTALTRAEPDATATETET